MSFPGTYPLRRANQASASNGRSPDSRHDQWAITAVLAYLGLIIVFGKGPTYLGYPPIFLGELVLGAGIIALLRVRPFSSVFAGQPVLLSVLILAFMSIGAVQTMIGIPQWGLNALRDAAVWYYAAFFFIGKHWGAQVSSGATIWKYMPLFWVLAVIWGTLNVLTGDALILASPVIAWRNVPVLSNSSSELGQNMALGAGILLGGYLLPKYMQWPLSIRVPLALMGLGFFVTSYGRGQKVGFAIATVTAVCLSFGRSRSPGLGMRIVALLILVAVVGLFIASYADVDPLKLAQLDRFQEADPSVEQGTHYWRMVWWKQLHKEVLATNPLLGLGFGVNLSIYNPFITDLEEDPNPVRAPHNINMTIYSRLGIVGASLWASILIVGIGRLSQCVWTGRYGAERYTPARREELLFWVVVLLTSWVNSSFGVLMEGPVLGVLFWFSLGFASARCLSSGAIERLPRLMSDGSRFFRHDLARA